MGYMCLAQNLLTSESSLGRGGGDYYFFFHNKLYLLILDPIANFSLSNDGKCLALSCLDNKIRLIERSSGELLSE